MRILKYIFAVLILGSLGLAIFSYIKSTQLPDKNLIIDPLYLEPVQKEVDIYTKPFEIKKQGFTYIITPLYEYEVFGLSVADYDSENWLDVFYKKDPLNTKDICLIWGDNIKNGFYKDIEFRQREFVCSWKLKKQNVIFSNNKISSNHLLPANNDIYNEFKQAQVGDQIYIKGYLANYQVLGLDTNFSNSTSTTRDDAGNGSSEIIYVTNFKILVKGNLGWKLFYKLNYNLCLFFIIVYLVAYFIFFITRPLIGKKEIIKEMDTQAGKGKSFPSTFK